MAVSMNQSGCSSHTVGGMPLRIAKAISARVALPAG